MKSCVILINLRSEVRRLDSIATPPDNADMTESIFTIGADGVDTDKIVEEIRRTVAEKTEQGLYADERVARAEKTNLQNIKDDEKFLDFYLECLRDAVFVDINDFDIHERRRFLPGLFIRLKRSIWNLLKFYTFRLWTQQNEINALLLSATEASEDRFRAKITELEARVAELEGRNSDTSGQTSEARNN